MPIFVYLFFIWNVDRADFFKLPASEAKYFWNFSIKIDTRFKYQFIYLK